MPTFSEIVIIGAGVSGMLTARELRLAGREVAILDKSAAGRESSWAGGGILLPLYPWRQAPAISTLVRHSLPKFPELHQQLLQATGIDAEWTPCGMLISQTPDLDEALAWCRQNGQAHAAPPAAQTQRFGAHFDQPLWLPRIAQIRNPRLLQALQHYLRQIGVNFIEHTEIAPLHIENRRAQALIAGGQRIDFNELIVCSGAWTGELLARLPGQPPSIEPVKGQMLAFDAPPGLLEHMILHGEHYLIPRRDGKILAGSTVESTGFDKTVTAAASERLHAFAVDLLPELRRFPVAHHWAGLRPGAPNGVPFICRHPAADNLSLNAGHFRNGLVMGPASAQLLSDILLARPPAFDPAPYQLTP